MILKDMTKREPNIDWHAAFYDAIRMELAQDWDKLQFEREHPLNLEPLRPDVIIIKKTPGAVLHQKFAEIFRWHNIIEFKSPEDSLSISDYMKAFSYPCIYQQEANIPYCDITLTLVREAYPRKLLKYIKTELKREVNEKSPGIFVIKGEMFPVQVIVGRWLSEEANIWLKNLNRGNLSVQTLQKMRTLKKDIGREINTEAYFYALFMAKANLLEEVGHMAWASLAELIEDMGFPQIWENRGIEKGINQGFEQGFEKGVEQGIERGREQGIEQGREQGIEQGIEMGIANTISIIKMLSTNVPPEKIAEEFMLPLEKIVILKSSLNELLEQNSHSKA